MSKNLTQTLSPSLQAQLWKQVPIIQKFSYFTGSTFHFSKDNASLKNKKKKLKNWERGEFQLQKFILFFLNKLTLAF